ARPKVREYLASGAKLVWLVDPVTRTVRVYRPGSSDIVVHTEDSDIALDAIAPGFSARVSSFFP
ncbi:MAG TPA: Uma2 family endonuclease, partial [Chloroflexota bacterium]|nr:Uma2 family endonuclease [Chloroflexota bacterium]